jgi:phosphate transport system ATP-binding protein
MIVSPAHNSAAGWARLAQNEHARAAETAPSGDNGALLSMTGVCASYNGKTVLKNLDCNFPGKQVTAILGPSGCGKSTLLRVLNRTLELIPQARVVAGTVSFCGEDIYAKKYHAATVRRQIGLIHQRPVPFPATILNDVLFGARYHRLLECIAPVEYARIYLEQTGLWNEVKDRLDDRAERLSGGQQQRLCLARTLANQPRVILMDEPCSSLDPAATKQIEDLIFQLKERYTIVVVTHNMAQAKRVADRVVFMFDGEIVERGAANKMFSGPDSKLAWDFISGGIG